MRTCIVREGGLDFSISRAGRGWVVWVCGLGFDCANGGDVVSVIRMFAPAQ